MRARSFDEDSFCFLVNGVHDPILIRQAIRVASYKIADELLAFVGIFGDYFRQNGLEFMFQFWCEEIDIFFRLPGDPDGVR